MTQAKKPKPRKAPPVDTSAPDEERLFGRVVKAFLAASKSVWNDPNVWMEERDSDDRRLLVWPRPDEGTGYERLLALLFNAEVEIVLVALRLRAHPALPAWPPDVHDPRFQVVLRVVQRACLKGEAAVDAFKDMSGADRLTGLRDFNNDLTAALVDWIQRSGLRSKLGDDAFELVGISRSVAYRAMEPRRR